MRNKIIIKVLVLLLLIFVVGCGGGENENGEGKVGEGKVEEGGKVTPSKGWSLQYEFSDSEEHVNDVAWAPDSKRVAAGGDDEVVFVWDVSEGKLLKTLKGQDFRIMGVDWAPDGYHLVSASYSGEHQGPEKNVIIWDTENDAIKTYLLAERAIPLYCVTWSPDGKRVAAGRWGFGVIVHDSITGELITVFGFRDDQRDLSLKAHTDTVAWSPDSNIMAAGSSDGAVTIMDVSHNKYLLRFEGHADQVKDMVWSPDGSMLATASHDKSIKVWETKTYKMVRSIEQPDLMTSVAWSPDGSHIATGGWNGVMKIWDMNKEIVVFETDQLPGKIASIKWSPDGKKIAVAYESRVGIWQNK